MLLYFRRQNHPSMVNALAKQGKNGYKKNPSDVHYMCESLPQLPRKSLTTHEMTDTDSINSRLTNSDVEYSDRNEMERKRKYEEEYPNSLKKQKALLSTVSSDRTEKVMVDKYHANSVTYNRQKEKQCTRIDDLRDKILSKHSKTDKTKTEAYETNQRRGAESERTHKRNQNDERVKSVCKSTHSPIRFNEKYDRKRGSLNCDKTKSRNFNSRHRQNSPSSKTIHSSSQNRCDNLSPKNHRNKRHSEKSDECRSLHGQRNDNPRTHKRTNNINTSEMCNTSQAHSPSEVICKERDKCNAASTGSVSSVDGKCEETPVEVHSLNQTEDKKEDKERGAVTGQQQKECGVYRVIKKWTTEESEESTSKESCVRSQSTTKLHVWQRAQSGKRLILKSVQEDVVDVSKTRMKEGTSTARLSLESSKVNCPEQKSEAISAKDIDVSFLESQMKKQTVCKEVISVTSPSLIAEQDVSVSELNMDDMAVIDETGSNEVCSFTHDLPVNMSLIHSKQTGSKSDASCSEDDKGAHVSSEDISTENADLANVINYSTSKKLSFLNDVHYQNKISTDVDQDCGTRQINCTTAIAESTRIEGSNENIRNRKCFQDSSSQETGMEDKINSKEDENLKAGLLVVSPSLPKEAGDLGSTLAPSISHNNSQMNSDGEPRNEEWQCKTNTSFLTAESLGLEGVEHTKRVDVHWSPVISEKSVNLQDVANAAKQKNKVNDLQLVSSKGMSAKGRGHNDAKSSNVAHSSETVIIQSGEFINKSYLPVSSKKLGTLYTAVARSSSCNSQDKATGLLSVAKTFVIKNSGEKVDSQMSSCQNDGTKMLKKGEDVTGVFNNSSAPYARTEPKVLQISKGSKETTENSDCNSSKLEDGDEHKKSSNVDDSVTLLESDEQITCNKKPGNLVSCSSECFTEDNCCSNNQECKVKLIKNNMYQICNPQSNVIFSEQRNLKNVFSVCETNVPSKEDILNANCAVNDSADAAAKQLINNRVANVTGILDVEEASSKVESIGISNGEKNHSLLSIMVSIPKSVISPDPDRGSDNQFKNDRCSDSSKKNDLATADMDGNLMPSDPEQNYCTEIALKQKNELPVSKNTSDSEDDYVDEEPVYVLHKIDNIPPVIKSWKSKLEEFRQYNHSSCEKRDYNPLSHLPIHKTQSYISSGCENIITSTPNPKSQTSADIETFSKLNRLAFNESAILSRSFSNQCYKECRVSVGVGEDFVRQNGEIENDCNVQQAACQAGDVCGSDQTTGLDVSATKRINTEPNQPECEVSCSSTAAYIVDSDNGHEDGHSTVNESFSIVNVTNSIGDHISESVSENKNSNIITDKDFPSWDIPKTLPSRPKSEYDDSRSTISDDVIVIQVYLDDSETSDSECTYESSVTPTEIGNTFEKDTVVEGDVCEKSGEVAGNDACWKSPTVTKNTTQDQKDVSADNNINTPSSNCDAFVIPSDKGAAPDDSATFLEGCARTRLFVTIRKKYINASSCQNSADHVEAVIPEDVNANYEDSACISSGPSICEEEHSCNIQSDLRQTAERNVPNTADVQAHCEKNSVNSGNFEGSHDVDYEEQHEKEFNNVPQQYPDSENAVNQKLNQQTEDAVRTDSCESSSDSNTSSSSSEESSNSDEFDTSSDSDSDSDLDEHGSALSSTSSGLWNTSHQTLERSDESDVTESHQSSKSKNQLFGKMHNKKYRSMNTSKQSSAYKSSKASTNHDKTDSSKTKDNPTKLVSNDNCCTSNADSPVHNAKAIEYPCISMDAGDCSEQLQSSSDEMTNETCSLEDGEISSESPCGSMCQSESKPNKDPLIKSKTVSVKGQQSAQRKGTKLNMDLHRPVVSKRHSSNRSVKGVPLLNEVKTLDRGPASSQKRPSSHFKSIGRSPKRKRLNISPLSRNRINFKQLAQNYSGRSERLDTFRKHCKISPIKSWERRVPRNAFPQNPVRHSTPLHVHPVKIPLEKGYSGHAPRNDRPRGPRTLPEVKRTNEEYFSNRCLHEISERCRRHSGGSKSRRNERRSQSPPRWHVKDNHANKHRSNEVGMRSSLRPHRRGSMDRSPHRHHGPRTPSPVSVEKRLPPKYPRENTSHCKENDGTEYSSVYKNTHVTPSRKPRPEIFALDSDSAKYRRTKSHSPTATMSTPSSCDRPREWKGPRTPPSPVTSASMSGSKCHKYIF